MLDPERLPLATTNALTIPSRFNGPAGIGNGGYVCGRIAAYVDGRATVTLRRPPPLDTPMEVERDDEGSVRVRHGRTLIGEAAPSPAGPLEIPATVSPAQADAAARGARYFTDPVFPDCFVCGMNRRPGDGLRIFPGPVTGLALWAAPWIPDPSVAGPDGRVRAEMVWAALDCPSGIAAAEAAGLGGESGWDTAILLGRMTVTTLAARPAVGDQCRVIAWPERRDGRKLAAGSALLGPDGEVLAVAGAVWLTVPRPGQARAAEAATAAEVARDRRLTGEPSRRPLPHKPSARSVSPVSPHDLHAASTGISPAGVTVGCLTSARLPERGPRAVRNGLVPVRPHGL